ncbi:hypothetical protein CIB95_03890 [Lottiidibacillus patelloidae]|uniref:DUF7878 domain-containing protein n=1 Tax=Lottiidibacillus patelloidae TaxID=2670334 RepID=A0A263BYI2_9BACI|nr:hypothetical protein [Lottiidibacillus patelloidae]OZM58720.1 hypothetical protein CIB95_03890 [Lottiidibacillus patelloidae]
MFILNTEEPTGPEYTAYEYGFIEGSLDIYLNEKLFFSEPYVNLAELAIQIGEWLYSIENGLLEDLNLVTIDHDEVILSFKYKGDNNWGVNSIWQEFVSHELIATTVLVECVKYFISELNKELHKINYVVKLDKYLQH